MEDIESNIVYKTEHQINHELLLSEFNELKKYYGLHDHRQISLTGPNQDADFLCSTGPSVDLEYPELCYSTILKPIKNTYTETCIKQFPDYYRWRFLILQPNSCYTIHRDYNPHSMYPESPISLNVRIHIPVATNPNSYMCFYGVPPNINKISDGKHDVYYYNMEAGKVYNTCTSYLHTAINHGSEPRIHLVGVKEIALNSADEIPEALKR